MSFEGRARLEKAEAVHVVDDGPARGGSSMAGKNGEKEDRSTVGEGPGIYASLVG